MSHQQQITVFDMINSDEYAKLEIDSILKERYPNHNEISFKCVPFNKNPKLCGVAICFISYLILKGPVFPDSVSEMIFVIGSKKL